jgi:cytochrome c peroxidase
LALAAVLVALGASARADTQCDFLLHGGSAGYCSCALVGDGRRPPSEFCPQSTAPCQIRLPRGFPCPRLPAENPVTVEKIELGRFLFYDTKMSRPGLAGQPGQACASCHQQEKGFTDGRVVARGSTGQDHPRNSMSLTNVVYESTLTWANFHFTALEEQAMVPMFGENPIELGLLGREAQLFDYLRSDRRYQRLFAEAFPGDADPFTTASITRAIASFERTLISGNSPRDRFELSESAIRGESFFSHEVGECFHCHGGFNLQDAIDSQFKAAPEIVFHNTGLYNLRCSDFSLPALDLIYCNPPPSAEACMDDTFSRPLGCHCDGPGPQDMGCFPPPNTGIYSVSDKSLDMGKFKAPTLRNIAVTGPYMHDGSIDSLDGVLDHYMEGGRTITDGPYAGVGRENPSIESFVRGFPLSESERADLLAFLNSLTDEEFLTNPKFADPFLPPECGGDCDLNGAVAVNELVLDVGISLETVSLARCVAGDLNGDGAVRIDELVRAVRSALNGCS